MVFLYRPFLEFEKTPTPVLAIEISPDGQHVCYLTSQSVVVWNLYKQKRYSPGLVTDSPVCVCWVDASTFLVGHLDGFLYSFTFNEMAETLTLSSFKACDGSITAISVNKFGTELAMARQSSVSIWRKIAVEGAIHWEWRDQVPSPPFNTPAQSKSVSLSWSDTDETILIVVYNHGIVAWNVLTLKPSKISTLIPPISKATINSRDSTVALIDSSRVLKYVHALSGIEKTLSYQVRRGFSIRFLHGGQYVVVGEDGHAVIISTSSKKIQTLWMKEKRIKAIVRTLSNAFLRSSINGDESQGPEIGAIGVYFNNSTRLYLIGIASHQRAAMWRGVGNDIDRGQAKPFRVWQSQKHWLLLLVGFAVGLWFDLHSIFSAL